MTSAPAQPQMRKRRIYRLAMVSPHGKLVGILSLNDLARDAQREAAVRLLQDRPQLRAAKFLSRGALAMGAIMRWRPSRATQGINRVFNRMFRQWPWPVGIEEKPAAYVAPVECFAKDNNRRSPASTRKTSTQSARKRVHYKGRAQVRGE